MQFTRRLIEAKWCQAQPLRVLGDGFDRAIRLRQLERTKKGIVWTKEQHSRDWTRVWKRIEQIAPLLAECDPKTVTPELLLDLWTEVANTVSDSEAHRLIKVWRALWKKMATFGFCECMAVAWDSQLSPVDARTLKASQLQRDPVGWYFELDRVKTGRGAMGTLSRRAERVLVAYMSDFGADLVGEAAIFRNRSGLPCSKDTLGEDFRDVRMLVFGPAENRQLADFRRTGTVEALAGGVDPETLSNKMTNTLTQSNLLHKTYAPVQLARVRQADAARQCGRTKLREQ